MQILCTQIGREVNVVSDKDSADGDALCDIVVQESRRGAKPAVIVVIDNNSGEEYEYLCCTVARYVD